MGKTYKFNGDNSWRRNKSKKGKPKRDYNDRELDPRKQLKDYQEKKDPKNEIK